MLCVRGVRAVPPCDRVAVAESAMPRPRIAIELPISWNQASFGRLYNAAGASKTQSQGGVRPGRSIESRYAGTAKAIHPTTKVRQNSKASVRTNFAWN
jgi:hypothetical protein